MEGNERKPDRTVLMVLIMASLCLLVHAGKTALHGYMSTKDGTLVEGRVTRVETGTHRAW
jgi:hypothetical protein